MSNDLNLNQNIDGFNDVDERSLSRVIKGRLVKFNNAAEWALADDDDETLEDVELIAVDIVRVVQKWWDKRPVETQVMGPAEDFPDLDARNASTPQKEWIDGPDGKKVGPWQKQLLVYLVDPTTMDIYTYATGSIGGFIATRELREKTGLRRRMYGDGVYPVVKLTDVAMKTRFGVRQRPHFKVLRFTEAPGGQNGGALLARPATPQIAAKPAFTEVPADDGSR
jgi:hypothetical protein